MTANVERRTPKAIHEDGLADTSEAYVPYHGWTLSCLWCDYQAQALIKREAVKKMNSHYRGFGIRGIL